MESTHKDRCIIIEGNTFVPNYWRGLGLETKSGESLHQASVVGFRIEQRSGQSLDLVAGLGEITNRVLKPDPVFSIGIGQCDDWSLDLEVKPGGDHEQILDGWGGS